MIRLVLNRTGAASVVVACGLLACGPVALADDLPLPPPLPPNIPVSEGAPVPDMDVQAPAKASGAESSLNVKFYRAKPYDPGMGFTPGSRYQSAEDRKPIQTPGFSLTVPIQ